jgi:nucleoside diphosphate kinase
MREELAYVLLTPYSILKSRTGGVLGRLMTLRPIELVATRMLSPSLQFVDALVQTFQDSGLDPKVIDLLSNYCRTSLGPNNKLRLPNRLLLLLFRGRNATAVLNREIGEYTVATHGDTLRGTYGDYLEHKDGRPLYFEPGLINAPNEETSRRQLEVLSQYADADGGVFNGDLPDVPKESDETTLVLIKPDSFRKASGRPGQIIDMFSRAGCYLVAMEMVRMSIAQAEEFFAPMKEQYRNRAQQRLESLLRAILPDKLGFRPSNPAISDIASFLQQDQARHQFNEIIKFMTGLDPALVGDPEERKQPSRTRSMALLYRGENAVSKVRAILGPTDPRSADRGTVSGEFGSDLLRNAAHASASVADADRERKILGIFPDGPSRIVPLIQAYLVRKGVVS